MTESQREWIGIAGGAGALALLYALQRSGGLGGLGGLGQSYAVQILNSNKQPITSIGPGTYYYIRVTGLQKTDWVETNADNVLFNPQQAAAFCPGGQCNGYNNTLPQNWTPQFTSYPSAAGATNATLAGSATEIIQGVWLRGQTSPQQPGNYTVLVAVDGQIIDSIPLPVQGAAGAYTGNSGIAPGTAVPGAVPASQTTTAAQAQAAQALLTAPATAAPASSAATSPWAVPTVPAAAAPSDSSAASTVIQMVPQNGSAAAAAPATGGSLTSMLETQYFGLPLWLLLAVAAGGIWYFTKEK